MRKHEKNFITPVWQFCITLVPYWWDFCYFYGGRHIILVKLDIRLVSFAKISFLYFSPKFCYESSHLKKMNLLNHKLYIKWLIRMIYVVLRPWLSIFATLHKTKNLIYHNNQTLFTCKGCKIWSSMWRDNDIPFLPFLIYHK